MFDFKFLSIIAMKDPLRNKVKSAIKFAKEQGQLEIRLVSGDHLETSKAVAIKAGILTSEDLGNEH